jgi:hypothetical protein
MTVEGARDESRNERDEHAHRKPPGPLAVSKAHQHFENLGPIEPHDREDRSQLDHHREHAARIVEPEQPFSNEQMGGRRNRQKLGEALHDAQQGGIDE